jgi:hypothetical protein
MEEADLVKNCIARPLSIAEHELKCESHKAAWPPKDWASHMESIIFSFFHAALHATDIQAKIEIEK